MSVPKTEKPQQSPQGKAAAGKDAAAAHQKGKTWGRYRDVDAMTILISFLIVAFCPLLVVYFYVSCANFQCSLLAPALFLSTGTKSLPAWAIPTNVSGAAAALVNAPLADKVLAILPRFSTTACLLYAAWVVFQALLYVGLPAKIGYGQMTPAGHILPYKVNGLLAWAVTHALYYIFSEVVPVFRGSIIANYWGGLLIASNIYGYALTAFCYAKAHLFPTHPEDRKFSGSRIYDFYMGIEFNPRFGKMFDFKLFHNGRPGIVAWTLINYSFAVAQYEKYGYVTNSMVLTNILHAMYVLDFFYNEDWYLRTIDIAHDHFGFYLSWGDSVWLPFMYTLQSHYLYRNPISLSQPMFLFVLALGLSGYYIFRAVNYQKDLVRRTDGDCLIWGKKPVMIRPKYTTSDGKEHHSILLASGFWGLSRHFNYLGDLAISLSMCLACGLPYPLSAQGHLLPYFYIIYMTILLVGRIYRDDARCRGKYGPYWDQYCKVVKYKLIPFIF
ncbi:hypothetical protein RI367_001532 [Sorochytrium milnesiophthora]